MTGLHSTNDSLFSSMLKDSPVLYSRVLLCVMCWIACTAPARALTGLSDADLRLVAAMDGVKMAGDLNIKLGTFVYLDTDATGGGVALNSVSVRGHYVQTVDSLSASEFAGKAASSMRGHGMSALDAATQVSTLLANGAYDMTADVVQIAFPDAGLDRRLSPTVHIRSVTMGNSTKSIGALQLKNFDLQGTSTWSWQH